MPLIAGLALTLLLSASATAAPRSADVPVDPRYWWMVHVMPPAYTKDVVVLTSAADAEAVQRAILDAGGDVAGVASSSVCVHWLIDLPSSRAREAALRRLASFNGRTTFEEPPYPDLEAKRDVLRKEEALLKSRHALADIPAVRGLLDAELATLDRLIERYRAASDGIEMDIVSPGETAGSYRTPPPTAQPGAIYSASMETAVWSRTTGDLACEVGVDFVWVDLAASDTAKARAALQAISGADAHPPCTSGAGFVQGQPIIFAVPPSAEEALRQRLREVGEIRSWRRAAPGIPGFGASTGRWKYRQLSRELSKAGGRLDDAPHVRALCEAELGRLQPTAAFEENSSSKTVVSVLPVPR